jgi:hypothetical protein
MNHWRRERREKNWRRERKENHWRREGKENNWRKERQQNHWKRGEKDHHSKNSKFHIFSFAIFMMIKLFIAQLYFLKKHQLALEDFIAAGGKPTP